MKIHLGVSLFLFLFIMTGCGFNDDGDENDKDNEGEDSESIQTEVSDNLTEVNLNVQTVEDNLNPPSVEALAVDNEGQGLQLQSDLLLLDLDDEADEVHDRIKDTLEGTMRALDWVHGMIDTLIPEVKATDNDEGEIDFGYMVMTYKFTSKTEFHLESRGGEGGDYVIDVKDDTYLMKRRPQKDEKQYFGTNFVEINYTDEKNWTVKDSNTSDHCDTRPKVIVSFVELKKGEWRGKQMVYGGSDDDGKCVDSATADDVDFTYYQFVGDEDVTTAAGYSDLHIGVENFDNIEDFGFADESDTNANPVCLEEGKDPVPAAACESDVDDIANATYGIEGEWLLPVDLAKIWNVFPDVVSR